MSKHNVDDKGQSSEDELMPTRRPRSSAIDLTYGDVSIADMAIAAQERKSAQAKENMPVIGGVRAKKFDKPSSNFHPTLVTTLEDKEEELDSNKSPVR